MVYKKSLRSKRQSRRRSSKRKNVKSRKVMRGGVDVGAFLRRCNAQNQTYQAKQALYNKHKDTHEFTDAESGNPCKALADRGVFST
jgi:hypothetical protein